MKNILTIVFLLAGIISCGKQSHVVSTETGANSVLTQPEATPVNNFQGYPAFPSDDVKPRSTQAAEDLIEGVKYIASKGSVNHIDFGNPTGYSIISNDINPVAYAQYVTEGFVDRPVSLSVVAAPTKLDKLDPKDLDFEYYIAVANFSNRSWDWFGPYSTDKVVELNSATKKDRYMSPTNKLHYVVLVAQNTKGQTMGATITATKSTSSATANPTMPIYSSISLIHIGQNIVDPTVKRVSVMSADQELTLVWMHKTMGIADDNTTEYELYANEVGKSSSILIAKVPAPLKDELVQFKVISDLEPAIQSMFAPSKTYQFYLRALNPHGASRRSWGESATIPTVLPPTNVKASINSASGIEITWTKSTGATGYRIYRDNQAKSIITLGDTDIYTDTAVTDSKDHSYWVLALNGKEESGFSVGATGHLTPLDVALPTPTNVTASTDLIGRILITWDAVPGADGYILKFDGIENGMGSTTNKYLDLTKTDLLEHTYEVSAMSKVLPFSPYSAPVKGKMKSIGGTLPNVNRIWATTNRSDGIELNWGTVPGATSYLMLGSFYYYYFQDQFNLTGTSYLDQKAIPGENRNYVIYALNDTEKSLMSASANGLQIVLGDSFEPDETIDQAKPFIFKPEQSIIKRSLSNSTDIDWFKFSADKGNVYNFYTLSSTGLNMNVYDASGLIIDTDYYSSAKDNNKYISFTAPVTGTYYIQIRPYSSHTLDYYFVYNEGEVPLIPPDVDASANRTDGILIEFNKVHGVEGYLIFRDKLDTPITTILNDGNTSYLDKVADFDEHYYWMTTFNGTKTSAVSMYNIGQRFNKDSYEPDDTTGTASLLTPTADTKTQVRSIAPANDIDYLKFTGTKDVTYQFWSTGGMDTYIHIYDNTITELAKNDDDGDGNNFYLAFTPKATALYYIKIRAYSSTRVGNYQFHYTTGLGYLIDGGIDITKTLDTGIKLIWATSVNADGYRIYRDSFDNKIAEVGKVDTYTDVTVFDMDPHKYWVQPYNATYDYRYTNSYWGQKVGTDAYEPNDTFDKGKLLAFSDVLKKQRHGIYPAKDTDWFNFEASKDTEYHISCLSIASGNITIEMFDKDGTTSLKSESFSSPVALDWVAPDSGTYYFKISSSNPATVLMYNLYYYSSTDTLPLPRPQNLKATTDRPDAIYLSWDPVPGANRYRVIATSPFSGSLYTSENFTLITNYFDTDITFVVKTQFYYTNDFGQTIIQESKVSEPFIGRLNRKVHPDWFSHSTGAKGNVRAIMQENKKPALVIRDNSSKIHYYASKVEQPTQNTDWVSHQVDASSQNIGAVALIGGKPAIAYLNAGKLIYNYSTKTVPSGAKGDWIKITTTFNASGDYLDLAEIDGKPAILYFDGSTLMYVMSKTPIPVDGDPKNWEAVVWLGASLNTEPVNLIPQAKNGYPAISAVNSAVQAIYGYATKMIPVDSDFKYSFMNQLGYGFSLTMLNGTAATTYIPKNTTQLTFAYTKSDDPQGQPWFEHIIDYTADYYNKSCLITTKGGFPAVIYSDIYSRPRIAIAKSNNPTTTFDWSIYQLDNLSSNYPPQILDAFALTGIYQAASDSLVYYTDWRD